MEERKMLKENYVAMVQDNYYRKQAEKNAEEYIQYNNSKKIKNKLKRFWKEWGISKEETGYLLACFAVFGSLFIVYILGILF
jgi:hypothetical protein